MDDIFQNFKNVYESLADEESKDIFLKRVLYNITLDSKYIDEIVFKYVLKTIKDGDKQNYISLINSLKKLTDSKKIIIYGANVHGKNLLEQMKDIDVECFCDQNKDLQTKGFCDKPVISPETLINKYLESCVIIIAVIQPYEEVYNFLIDNKFSEKSILNVPYLYDWYEAQKQQYFDKNIIKYEKNEVFYDCGCLNCYTILSLMKNCNSIYKVYAFEPDEFNIKSCEKTIEKFNLKNVVLIKAGVWSKSDTLKFCENNGGTSFVGEDGNVVINVVSIDEIANGGRVSFIKMDIEGSELEALKGARETIVKYEPKLAISLYHKNEDIIEIPKYVKGLVPEYKIYIRHYSNNESETVMYAVK